ncbi:unnamed protein product [Arctogadus glacialis]
MGHGGVYFLEVVLEAPCAAALWKAESPNQQGYLRKTKGEVLAHSLETVHAPWSGSVHMAEGKGWQFYNRQTQACTPLDMKSLAPMATDLQTQARTPLDMKSLAPMATDLQTQARTPLDMKSLAPMATDLQTQARTSMRTLRPHPPI